MKKLLTLLFLTLFATTAHPIIHQEKLETDYVNVHAFTMTHILILENNFVTKNIVLMPHMYWDNDIHNLTITGNLTIYINTEAALLTQRGKPNRLISTHGTEEEQEAKKEIQI